MKERLKMDRSQEDIIACIAACNVILCGGILLQNEIQSTEELAGSESVSSLRKDKRKEKSMEKLIIERKNQTQEKINAEEYQTPEKINPRENQTDENINAGANQTPKEGTRGNQTHRTINTIEYQRQEITKAKEHQTLAKSNARENQTQETRNACENKTQEKVNARRHETLRLIKRKKKSTEPEMKIKRRRRWWIKSAIREYDPAHFIEDLKREPSGQLEHFCRMTATDFEILLNKVGPIVAKKNTRMRKCIPAEGRLAATLRFLATGDSLKSLGQIFQFSAQSTAVCVDEVCCALIQELGHEMKMPASPQEWLETEAAFQEKCNFPHCIGALDAKHIVVQPPLEFTHANGKSTFSRILTALVDSDYCFTYAHLEPQGRIIEGIDFNNWPFFKQIDSNELMLPPEAPLPAEIEPLPYIFVAGEAFPLSKHIQKQYPGTPEKNSKEIIFNDRLSKVRSIAENAIGVLGSVFKVLQKPLLLHAQKVPSLVMACLLLHNFLRRSETSRDTYSPLCVFDQEEEGEIRPGTWRSLVKENKSFKPVLKVPVDYEDGGKSGRETIADYLVKNDATL